MVRACRLLLRLWLGFQPQLCRIGWFLPYGPPGDVDSNGYVDDADLLAVLFAFGGSGEAEDVNDDGVVDDADLLIVLFAFGDLGSNLGRKDVNCDGSVDDGDLLIVLFNFGQGC